MRVAILFSDGEPESGGEHTFEREIYEALLNLSEESMHDFFVVNRKCPNDLRENDKNKNARVSYIPYGKNKKGKLIKNRLKKYIPFLRKYWLESKEIEQLLLDANIDFVWQISQTTTYCLNIPYMATVWDLQHRIQPYFPEVIDRGMYDLNYTDYSRYMRQAAIILVGNNTGKGEVERYYQVSPDRLRIVPQMAPAFSINTDSSNVDIQGKYNLPNEYLFYPAQFWPHKNHVNLLLAIKTINEYYNKYFPIVFCGSDKGNLDYVKRVARELGLDRQIHFLNFVPLEDLTELYKNAFALVFVSLFGPDNLPPLEAFALGCPVIAMNVPGMKEQLGDAALFAEPSDPDSISLQVIKLSDDSILRQELITKGRKRAGSWTSTNYVRKIFSILDDFQYYRRCWPGSIIL